MFGSDFMSMLSARLFAFLLGFEFFINSLPEISTTNILPSAAFLSSVFKKRFESFPSEVMIYMYSLV